METPSCDSRQDLLELLAEYASSRVSSSQQKLFAQFSNIFIAKFPLEELQDRSVADIFGLLRGWFSRLDSYPGGEPSIELFNPRLDEDEWVSKHTVAAVIQPNMPFLMDSVRMEFNRRNISVHTVHNVIVKVARDSKGQLIELASHNQALANKGDVSKFGLIHVEVSKTTDIEHITSIQNSLSAVLDDVATVVDGFDSMRSLAQAACDDLKAVSKGGEEVSEGIAFVEWMVSNNFTFLGATKFDYSSSAGFVEDVSARGGLFVEKRDPVASVELAESNEGVRQFIESDNVILFSKASVRSTIHRNAYSDYVTVKRLNKKGEMIGEYRFLGLFTAAAYSLPVATVPVIRKKAEWIVSHSGLDMEGHDGKALQRLIEIHPRDELFQSTKEELHDILVGVMQIQEREKVRLFFRSDAFGKFVTCLAYWPRDIYNTELRFRVEDILVKAVGGIESDFTTYFSESILARTQFVIRVDPRAKVAFDVEKLEAKVVAACRRWSDLLLEASIDEFGEEEGYKLYREYYDAFQSSYQERYDPRTAAHDMRLIKPLDQGEPLAMSFYHPRGEEAHVMRFKIFQTGEGVVLSDVIPVLENFGLRVIGESPNQLIRATREPVSMHDFLMTYEGAGNVDAQKSRDQFQEAFSAIWSAQGESDAFNRLVLCARLSWREVAVLRSYARYMRQMNFGFSQHFLAETLVEYADIARLLVAQFKALFDPKKTRSSGSEAKIQQTRDAIVESIDQVTNLSQDRILRQFLALIEATLRTNYFQLNEDGSGKDYISFKLNSRVIPNIPKPAPAFEIFVYSPRVEGVHLRGGKVARGGLRWSDRYEDYRTEVLGLVKAQQVKNSVIVPVGAKGGFVAKHLPEMATREEQQAEGVACYKIFIRGLLDLTDNRVEGKIVPPVDVVSLDEPDPYMVVAADKGTATFSDVANAISEEYGFWLGDAFASGGSNGYDHKKMGITAKGAWVSVQRHFREMGIDVQTNYASVVGIGDMSGDVFGNGLLLSESVGLVAAFNHMYIFVDPDPEVAASYAERKRMFDLPRSSWADYDTSIISEGGGVFKRSAKSINISPQMKRCFDIESDKLTPNELIKALLKSPVDLIWNGGIGTYVKSESESHTDVGDKANDVLRINGSELRTRVFGEGGNLGMTQRGRVEYCLAGGRCNTDFIDNAAGVDCSDHEVNVKILLNELVAQGELTQKHRNKILESMTDDVSGLVLSNNYRQVQALTIAEMQAYQRMGEYQRFIQEMESVGGLDRALEFIPTDAQLDERKLEGKGLTRPELSVLVSYAKADLKQNLADTKLVDDSYMLKAVRKAFPTRIREEYAQSMNNHQLRKELLATQLANNIVNLMGPTFVRRLQESTGAKACDIARAYVVARDIFDVTERWKAIEALEFKVSVQVQFEMQQRIIRLVRQATRWFLKNRRTGFDVAVEVENFKAPFAAIESKMETLLSGEQLVEYQTAYERALSRGKGEEIARFVAAVPRLYSLLGIIDQCNAAGSCVETLAESFFTLGERSYLHWFNRAITDMSVNSHWQALAREAYIDDLEWQQRKIARSITSYLDDDRDFEKAFSEWSANTGPMIVRWRTMIDELKSHETIDMAMFTVALRELLDLAESS